MLASLTCPLGEELLLSATLIKKYSNCNLRLKSSPPPITSPEAAAAALGSKNARAKGRNLEAACGDNRR